MRFLEFTRKEGDKICINPAYVVAFGTTPMQGISWIRQVACTLDIYINISYDDLIEKLNKI